MTFLMFFGIILAILTLILFFAFPSFRAQAEWDYKTSVGVAEHISNLQFPEVYISGKDGGKSSSILEELLGAEFAKKMLNSKR